MEVTHRASFIQQKFVFPFHFKISIHFSDFMAGFYGGRVLGTPGPPNPMGHTFPGMQGGPHHPSPWPSPMPGKSSAVDHSAFCCIGQISRLGKLIG
jgi:hypothetical protein